MTKLFSVLATTATVIGVVGALVMYQFFTVQKAHSSFDNYYHFRGCTKLLQKTNTFATCTTDKGQTIKIVKDHDKWYLDGDLPACYFHICL